MPGAALGLVYSMFEVGARDAPAHGFSGRRRRCHNGGETHCGAARSATSARRWPTRASRNRRARRRASSKPCNASPLYPSNDMFRSTSWTTRKSRPSSNEPASRGATAPRRLQGPSSRPPTTTPSAPARSASLSLKPATSASVYACGRLPPRLRGPVGEHADGVGPRADVPPVPPQHVSNGAATPSRASLRRAPAGRSASGPHRVGLPAAAVPSGSFFYKRDVVRGPTVPGRARFSPLNCQSPHFSAARRASRMAPYHTRTVGSRRCLGHVAGAPSTARK